MKKAVLCAVVIAVIIGFSGCLDDNELQESDTVETTVFVDETAEDSTKTAEKTTASQVTEKETEAQTVAQETEKVTVAETTVAETTAAKTEPEQTAAPVTEYVGRTVYITPTGKKYHYSASCAGKNAIPKSEDSVKNSYGPCKKCVG